MDRNIFIRSLMLFFALVALRKESVDRNCYLDNIEIAQAKSLSARRAWIEISDSAVDSASGTLVALRKESVDRNDFAGDFFAQNHSVALRKESVDRNCRNRFCPTCQWSRSPQGERG